MNTVETEKVKRIAIVGPECTGKTDLAMALASHYQTFWVPEYARNYIDRLERPYIEGDLHTIAQWQLFTEDSLALKANRILICDTDLTIIKVWSEHKYGRVDPKIIALMKARTYDLHLLTYVDIPWEDDPQREHPDKREYFFNLYKRELEQQGILPVEIRGTRAERVDTAITAIDRILQP